MHELKDPVVFIAMGLGSGLSPKAPGTAGTLLTVPLVYFLQQQTLFYLYSGDIICIADRFRGYADTLQKN